MVCRSDVVRRLSKVHDLLPAVCQGNVVCDPWSVVHGL